MSEIDSEWLLDCLRENTDEVDSLGDDQYILPDGHIAELLSRTVDDVYGETDRFTRHHDVRRCYIDQFPDDPPEWINAAEGDAIVADFLDRTGSIRVARVRVYHAEFEASALRPPTDEQMSVLRPQCSGRDDHCAFDIAYHNHNSRLVFRLGYAETIDEGMRHIPLQRALCREYKRILPGIHDEDLPRVKAWVREMCRVGD